MARPTSRREFVAGVAASLLGGCTALGTEARKAALVSARNYGTFPGERREQAQSQELFNLILPDKMRHNVTAAQAAQRGIAALAAMLRDRLDGFDEALHNSRDAVTTIVAAPKKLVVFSDHHLANAGHRHNVFSGPGGRHYRYTNHALYEAVLRRYNERTYTVVENGDVEDLVVFDPANHPGEFERRLEACRKLDVPTERMAELVRCREAFRRGVLAEILSDPVNQSYYALLAELDRDGRLYRTAGNHDYMRHAMWDEAVERARAVRPGFEFPTNERSTGILVLTRGESWETVVLHGHQFDHSSSPLNASLHGETISECLGVWYQGADRIWPWTEWCEQWTDGRPFTNRLVSGTPTPNDELRDMASIGTPYSPVVRAEARQRLWSRPTGPGLWEQEFEHPVAWEYLERPGDGGAGALISVYRAVVDGHAWFKYRHTEELLLADLLPKAAGTRLPNVVLGHTHEPRAGAIDAFGEPVEWYLNSGAAGRFEGLLWAVEILDGEATVVSWHAKPFPSGTPVRRVWRPAGPYREQLASREEPLA